MQKASKDSRKRAKTAASIAFLMGSLLVLIVVLGWQLTAFSRERSVIATAGIAVAVATTVIVVFGYALVLVHAFVDRRNRNLMIFQTGGQHIRGGADRSRACRPSPDSRTGTVADSVRVRHRRAVASRGGRHGTRYRPVLTTDNVPPALRKKYLEEGMTPATPNECEIYALEPSDDPLILLPKGRSTP